MRDRASLSSVSAARSALSCFLCKYEGVTFGNTDLVRFIKGTFEQTPIFPKQLKQTWDVNIVLTMLNTLILPDKLTLKELTLKLVMLTALLSGQRCQTLHALDTAHMSLKDKQCTFFVNSVLKHTRRGVHQAPIELVAFTDNKNLCVISTLQEYLQRTCNLR